MDQVVRYCLHSKSVPVPNQLYTVTRYSLKTVASYSPVCLMHEKINESSKLLTVRFMVRKILYVKKKNELSKEQDVSLGMFI